MTYPIKNIAKIMRSIGMLERKEKLKKGTAGMERLIGSSCMGIVYQKIYKVCYQQSKNKPPAQSAGGILNLA